MASERELCFRPLKRGFFPQLPVPGTGAWYVPVLVPGRGAESIPNQPDACEEVTRQQNNSLDRVEVPATVPGSGTGTVQCTYTVRTGTLHYGHVCRRVEVEVVCHKR